MIKAKITKIDIGNVHLLTAHGDKLKADRLDIDFGVLEGDTLFLKTEKGKYIFRRVEKSEIQEGEPYYYDADWKKRENEYQLLDKPDVQKDKPRNYPLYVLIAIIVLFVIVEIFRRNIFFAIV